MDETQLLQQARSAIKSGDKVVAKGLLQQVIRQDADNEVAWLWMSAITDNPAHERECLRRVLEINPSNDVAQKHWQKFQGTAPPPAPSFASTPIQDENTSAAATATPVNPTGATYTLIHYCPICGALNRRGDSYCTSCGSQLPNPEKSCLRCGKERSFLGSLGIGFSNTNGRCGKCEKEVARTKVNFRLLFLDACKDGLLQESEWAELEQFCAEARMPLAEALQFVKFRTLFLKACKDGLLEEHEWSQFERFCTKAEISLTKALQSVKTDALKLVERTLAFAKADGEITHAEEAAIYALQRRLQLTDHETAHIRGEIDQIVLIVGIRKGRIPTTRPSVMLRADEVCHEESYATYWKPLKKGPTPYPGRLVITNQRVMFIAQRGGTEFPISKIVNVRARYNGIDLELSRQTGNGFYQIPRPEMAMEILRTLVRLHNRRLVAENGPSRHIPQDVKVAVWQRDRGRCVGCGATDYLEFDHIIPFSKGGASTVNNVQLLCRRCNLRKGDSI